MIDAKINGPAAHIEASGDVIELTVELGTMVRAMYNTIENEEMKAMFKDAAQVMLKDGSPVWGPVPVSKSGKMTAVYMEKDREKRRE